MAKCGICKSTLTQKDSHNSEPLNRGAVCGVCNSRFVIPVRLMALSQRD